MSEKTGNIIVKEGFLCMDMKLISRIAVVAICMCICNAGAQDAKPEYLSDVQGTIVLNTQGWGELGIDTAAHLPDQNGVPLQIQDKVYKKGLGSHANSEIVIDLGGAFSTFESEVGVQRQVGGSGSIIFKILADEKEIFNSGKMTQETPAKSVNVSVAGVQELKLIMLDAGDGVTCDLGNWAEARITRASKVDTRTKLETVDIAPFGRVLTWDPSRMDGCKNNRFEEFTLDDLYPATDVVPCAEGVYNVPKWKDGKSCIGLQWLEQRHIKEIEIQFADKSKMPSSDGVQVQYWVMTRNGGSPGGSVWQGNWKNLNGTVEKQKDTWKYVINWNDSKDRRRGTLKIRWVFPVSSEAISVRKMMAFTDSKWKTVDLMLQFEKAGAGEKGLVKIYNGEILNKDNSGSTDWKLSKPLHLKVRYCTTTNWMTDRTVLRLNLPNGSFGVAVDDVLLNGCVYVKDLGLFVTSDQAKITLDQYKKAIVEKKTILERVSTMPDQTFKQADEHVHRADADFGATLLSLECDNHKFIASRDGTVEFDNNPEIFNFFAGHLTKKYSCQMKPEFGSGTSKDISRQLQDGWFPIIITTVKDNGIVYRQRTFVAPYNYDPAVVGSQLFLNRKPLGVAQFTVENPQDNDANVSLAVKMFSDVEKGEFAENKLNDSRVLYFKSGKPLAALSVSSAASLKYEIKDGVWMLTGRLSAKEKAECIVYMPGWDVTTDEIAAIGDCEKLAADTEAYWTRVMEPAMSIEIPDSTLQNLIKASQVHCMLAARNEDYNNVAPWVASTYYGPIDMEAQSVIRGMQFNGNYEYSRKALDYYIKRYNKQGFVTPTYTIMGTGWHLWCLGEYYELTKDNEWLKKNADEIARVCKWIMAEREKTKRFDAFGNKVPEWGLLPPGTMADWEVFCFYFNMNGYYYAGLNAAGHALDEIAYPGAKDIIASANELREDIINAFHWTQSQSPVYPLQDGTWVPAYPTHVYCPGPIDNFYKGEDLGRTWCYDVELGAHQLIAHGVMDPNSKDANWMMNHMEDVQFLADGYAYDGYSSEKNKKDWFNLGGFAKVQPYYARVGEIYALQDNEKAFIRTYFNSVISLLNRENLSLWEHFMNAAFNKTHETGYFLYQSRTMLVTERGDQLWLAPFVTNNWLKDGMKVAVSKAPTRWGQVGYRIESHVNDGYIDAEIVPPVREVPKEIVIRLRHPEGKKISSVEVDGKKYTNFDPEKDIIRLTPSTQRIVVRAMF